MLWDTPAGSAGGTSRDDASWPELNSHPDAKILVPPKNPGSILQRAGGARGQCLRDLRASGSHLKSSLSTPGWSMVTLKNIDSATHASWRYPTKSMCSQRLIFWIFAPGLSQMTLLCQMHSFILNGNCLVELNLTSKRNNGWVGLLFTPIKVCGHCVVGYTF